MVLTGREIAVVLDELDDGVVFIIVPDSTDSCTDDVMDRQSIVGSVIGVFAPTRVDEEVRRLDVEEVLLSTNDEEFAVMKRDIDVVVETSSVLVDISDEIAKSSLLQIAVLILDPSRPASSRVSTFKVWHSVRREGEALPLTKLSSAVKALCRSPTAWAKSENICMPIAASHLQIVSATFHQPIDGYLTEDVARVRHRIRTRLACW